MRKAPLLMALFLMITSGQSLAAGQHDEAASAPAGMLPFVEGAGEQEAQRNPGTPELLAPETATGADQPQPEAVQPEPSPEQPAAEQPAAPPQPPVPPEMEPMEEGEMEPEGPGVPADVEEEEEEEEPSPGEKTADKTASPPVEKPKEGVVILHTNRDKKPQPYSLVGATPLDWESTALRVAIGYPEVQVLFQMPWDQDIELSVGGGLYYGFNAATAGDLVGLSALGEARWRFWKDGEHAMALTVAPSLLLTVHPRTSLGLVIGGPGINYDYRVNGQHHVVLGFSIPWGGFLHGDGFSARIPVLFKMAMEFALSQNLHAFVSADMGLDAWTGGLPLEDDRTLDGVYFFARGLVGLGFLM